MPFPSFSDEQRRTLLNLAQYYDAWRGAEREMRSLSAHPLHWKTIGGRDYLYAVRDSRGNATSRGPRSAQNEALHRAWHAARDRRDGAKTALAEVARLYRALRFGSIAAEAAAILREADVRGLLGTALVVVGTNAMPAYEIEAQSRMAAGIDETMDFELAWIGSLELAETLPDAYANPVWDLLKSVDSTYTINSERAFQARNAKAYEVELLVSPSRAASLGRGDRPVPIPLPEQEWLLEGTRVDQVVCARDGSPARIVAPDPRWFALHKLWMSEQARRNALKKPKDRKQGERLLEAIAIQMPHYPLDDGFAAGLPPELEPIFARWRDHHAGDSPTMPSW